MYESLVDFSLFEKPKELCGVVGPVFILLNKTNLRNSNTYQKFVQKRHWVVVETDEVAAVVGTLDFTDLLNFVGLRVAQQFCNDLEHAGLLEPSEDGLVAPHVVI